METNNARSIFSEATGFIRRGGFDWTCNPYLGCTFGCVYCYAMFLPQNRRPKLQFSRSPHTPCAGAVTLLEDNEPASRQRSRTRSVRATRGGERNRRALE